MQVTIDLLKEVMNHLQSVSDQQSDFEYESQQHQDYLDTIALCNKVGAHLRSMEGRCL